MLTRARPANNSLRDAMGQSRVAAVSIAILLFWSLYAAVNGLWTPIFRALNFAFEAVAILDIPYFSRQLTGMDRVMLSQTFSFLFAACVAFFSAWLLSRWIYGTGPFHALSRVLEEFRGDHDV